MSHNATYAPGVVRVPRGDRIAAPSRNPEIQPDTDNTPMHNPGKAGPVRGNGGNAPTKIAHGGGKSGTKGNVEHTGTIGRNTQGHSPMRG